MERLADKAIVKIGPIWWVQHLTLSLHSVKQLRADGKCADTNDVYHEFLTASPQSRKTSHQELIACMMDPSKTWKFVSSEACETLAEDANYLQAHRTQLP